VKKTQTACDSQPAKLVAEIEEPSETV